MNINSLFHLRLKLLLKIKTLEVSNLIIKRTPLKLNANTNLKNMGCSLNRDLFNSFCLLPTRSRCTIIYLFILSLKPHINIKTLFLQLNFRQFYFDKHFEKQKARKPCTKLRKEEKERLKFWLRKSRNYLYLYI